MVKFLVWLSRYLLAATFIFSGFVKGIDPLGSAYKFGDYFMAFGMDFMLPLTLPLSFILCAAELYIGFLLLFNIQKRVGIWGAFLFMAVFTPLTFVLAIFDPVSDCGCFGDAIILSNWETFFKNIPLFGASILLFNYRKKQTSNFPLIQEIAIATILLALSFYPSLHGYLNLPMIDFRPYSVGTNIPEAMAFPPDAPMDEYKTLLYYEKDGVVKEFTQENFPWQDSTWQFVDSKSILIKKGYSPPISDFAISEIDGLTVTDNIIYEPGYYLLAVSYRLDKAKPEVFDKFNELYFKAREQGIGFACVTASTPNEIDSFIGTTGVAFPFLMADEIMLKTTVRSNPGLILLYNGTIIGKWHHRNIPENSFFEGDILSNAIDAQMQNGESLKWYLVILSLILIKVSLYQSRKLSRKS